MKESPASQDGSASFYRLAQAELSQRLPLLAHLSSQDKPADEDLDALRSAVRSQLGELIEEFATVGGPRIARVDHLFSMLLGQHHRAISSKISGSIGDLGSALSRKQEPVNTVDDEQNLTNFRIFADYVTSLRDSWELTSDVRVPDAHRNWSLCSVGLARRRADMS